MGNRLTVGTSAAAMLITLCGCCGPVRDLYPPAPGDARTLYVVDNHWHTGFVLRSSDLTPSLRAKLAKVADAPYVEIGWGDDRFYRSPKSTSGLALGAMFASQGSVIHAVPIWSPPEWHYLAFIVDLYQLQIGSDAQRRLIDFIDSSLERTQFGSAIELEPGWAPGSWFYRARGRYSMFHTCNQWTADALRTTGFPITAFYASTAGNVGWQIRTFGREYQPELMLLHDGKATQPLAAPTTGPG